ncbi:MAG TPA: phage holin family protein [Verrucomicrobiota bacterium]|nr:phage holin family protein [Verrucomicrobiota bacterium]
MSDSTESPGLLASLRRLGSTVSRTISNRVELLLVEVQLERTRFLHILVLLLVALALAFLAMLCLTAAIVVWLGATHPVLVLLGLAALYGFGAWWMVRRVQGLLAHESFAGSLSELKKDQAWLHQQIFTPSNSGGDSSSPKAS